MSAEGAAAALLPSTLSPEARLVLLCCGGPGNDTAIAQLLSGPLDWARVTTIAEREVVLPQVWGRLSPQLPGGSPADVEGLRTLAMVHEFRLQSRFQHLSRAVGLLQEAGIPVVLLKGCGLAVSRYPDLGARDMQDHDLLVHRADAMRARDLLSHAGWFWIVENDADHRYRKHHHLPPLHRLGDDSTTLELHVGLFSTDCPLLVPLDALWASAERARLGEVEVLVPDREHQLLHAAIHYAYSHMFLRGAARALCDLRVLIEGATVDWERFTHMAQQSRASACIYWALWVGREVGGVTCPEGVLRDLAPRISGLSHRLASRHILGCMVEDGNDCPSVTLQRSLWTLATDPEGSGQGLSRPWHFDPDKPDQGSGGEATSGGRERLRPWLRYLRSFTLPPVRSR